jgi:predicted S18 family serine protease
MAGKARRLDVVGRRPPRAPSPDADRREVPYPQAVESKEWLSERDFLRTLELVDRTCQELRASEARVRSLSAEYEKRLRETEERLETAREQLQYAEERAQRTEGWARHLEERTITAEARAIEAEERANALEEWADCIQATVEEMASKS